MNIADYALSHHLHRLSDSLYLPYVERAIEDPHTGACRCSRCEGIVYGLKYLVWYNNGTGWYDCASAHPSLEDAIQAARKQGCSRITRVGKDGNDSDGVIWRKNE
jgi:hypothetical protein